MRTLAHFTPRYVFYRLMDIWYQKRHPDQPWITPQAVQILQSWVQPGDKAIEWGSGKSTLWFAKRIAHVVSIEHDPLWYEKTSLLLKNSGLANRVDYRLLPVTDEISAHTRGKKEGSVYALVVKDFRDESFDLALVDGKIRHVCMEMALPKIRPGGMLILDNAERYIPTDAEGTYFAKRKDDIRIGAEWRDLLSKIKCWRTIVTTNGIWRTRLWIKPG